MSDALRVQRAERTPRTTWPRSSVPRSDLPTDILEQGARRLGRTFLFYAFGYFGAYFGPILFDLIRTGAIAEWVYSFKTIVAAASIMMGLALFAVSRWSRIAPARLLDIGLVFEVIGAFGISMTAAYGAYPEWSPELLERVRYGGIPWECVWIVIFPLLAPNRPWKILIASLAAASMGPLVITISKATGATSPNAPWLWFANYYLFTSYFCAILAFIASRWVRQYGMQIKKAREIGQYRLTSLLGKGGMGEVWLARHQMLARPAAVKLIRPEALGKDENSQRAVMLRFEREAQATARLRSKHTISVYDFGITDEGVFYYAMELLDGLDLDTLVKRFGPLPADRTIYLLRQACHSLIDAHERGMIHRDIKPANIFTCRLGPDHDFIKVLDFGLVKSERAREKDLTQLTQEGVAIGTPGFMPPEMAMRDTEIDGRADLYALGCVGYWLLTGEPVFEGDTPLATVLHHVKTPPIPPSERTEITVPADLEAVILECLAKEPAKRPASARELDARLAECQPEGAWGADEAAEWWALHLPEDASADEPGAEPPTSSLAAYTDFAAHADAPGGAINPARLADRDESR